MALFILRTFNIQDEEIQGLHLPVIFSSIMNILNVSRTLLCLCMNKNEYVLQLHVREDSSRASSSTVREVLILQEEILRQTPLAALLRRPELTAGAQAATASQSPYGFACTFYGIKPTSKFSTQKNTSSVPFASAFEDLIGLSTNCGRRLVTSKTSLPLRDALAQLLLILGKLVDRLEGREGEPIQISWSPNEWFSVVLETFELEVLFPVNLLKFNDANSFLRLQTLQPLIVLLLLLLLYIKPTG